MVLILKILGMVPSGSVPSKFIFPETSSVKKTVLLVAIGVSFTGLIEIEIVALLLSEKPS